MLFGKQLIVTGVASGIGKRTAELAQSLGAYVVGIDASPLSSSVGTFIQGDLSNEAGIKDIVAKLPTRVDALLAIAGVSGTGGAEKTLHVNFYGIRAMAELMAPRIREGGSVVSIASFAGYGWRSNVERTRKLVEEKGFPSVDRLEELGVPNELGYPISKEALIMWTQKACHQPLFRSRGIRINAVSPGPVETPILLQFRQVLG
jgi:NAD(P)-dependent dehydrogenase (short-subunit alcohol dehydrogenase family)